MKVVGSDLIVDTDLQINGYLRGDEVMDLINQALLRQSGLKLTKVEGIILGPGRMPGESLDHGSSSINDSYQANTRAAKSAASRASWRVTGSSSPGYLLLTA